MNPVGPLASFMFHEVTDDPTASGYQRPGALPYTVARASFESYLDAIATSGRTPTLLGDFDLADAAPHLLLTFDDGGRSALDAGDRLLRRGWCGHFFVVTSRIGTRGFLDRTGIRYLRSCGHLIGSHSHTHPDIFRELTPMEMSEEWEVSRATLEQVLGEPCTIASLPGGDLSAVVRESVRRSRYKALFTSEPWLAPRRAGACLLLGRYAVKAGLSPTTFGQLASLHGWSRALLRRRCSVIVRRALGPVYRHYVHRQTAADRTPVPAS